MQYAPTGIMVGFKKSIYSERKTMRLQNYEYSQNGLYFITICTKDHYCAFGNIDNNGKIFLNDAGIIVNKEISNTERIRENIKIHNHVIMPNHIHLLIEIRSRGVLHTPTNINNKIENNNKPKLKSPSNTIGAIVRGFKSSCTRKINELCTMAPMRWERNYYDHIIRDEKSYLKIAEYIENNPLKWYNDRYYCK